ncbi:MAG: 50S ribosomal protein L10 [Candidatus Micrarchaeia archaeon]
MSKDHKADVNKKNVAKKAKKVEEILGKMKKHKSAALIELKNLPDVLLQKSRKEIRKSGEVISAKRAVFERVFSSDKKLKNFLEKVNEPVALILSDKSPFELAQFFNQNKKKMAAKVGQTSPYEIIVPEGETELPPGPALSELKGAGLAVQIRGGKIAVSKDSVLAKKGELITDKKAKALQMLGILPFEKGINIIYAHDGEYLYTPQVLAIDSNYVNNGISNAYNLGKNLSINANYPTKSTINIFITNAYMQGKNFSINGKIYSKESIGQLLNLAKTQGLALSELK